jgi:hypothetical protein
MTNRFDGLYKHALGAEWKWAKAVAIVESGENEWALGDGGRARGLFQMWDLFFTDYAAGPAGADASMWWWMPPVQVAIFANFWSREPVVAYLEGPRATPKLLVFHYGLTAARDLIEGFVQHGEPLDPDGYVQKVLSEYRKL